MHLVTGTWSEATICTPQTLPSDLQHHVPAQLIIRNQASSHSPILCLRHPLACLHGSRCWVKLLWGGTTSSLDFLGGQIMVSPQNPLWYLQASWTQVSMKYTQPSKPSTRYTTIEGSEQMAVTTVCSESPPIYTVLQLQEVQEWQSHPTGSHEPRPRRWELP